MQKKQGAQHRETILKLIAQKGNIARVDIAKLTGINQGSVTSLTSDLITEGIVEENKYQDDDSNRGRPRVALKLVKNSAFVAGVKLTSQEIVSGIFDLTGELVSENHLSLNKENLNEETLIEAIYTGVERAIQKSGKQNKDIKALGVGLPGFVDVNTGIVHWSPFLEGKTIHLRQHLEEAFQLPVIIDNDVNLVALAERKFGLGRDCKNFLVVTVEHGVGMGLVMNGEVFRGMRGVGNEFGHTKIQFNGALCRCGQRGCLEAYVADYALLREADTILNFSGKDISAEEKMSRLVEMANNGEVDALSIFKNAARVLGAGLANLVNLLDPELIILAGRQMRYAHLYQDLVKKVLKDNVIRSGHGVPEVQLHDWGDLPWAQGAAAFAIERAISLIAEHSNR